MRRLFFSLALASLLAVTGTIQAQVLLRDIPAPSTSAGALTWDGGAFWIGDNSSTLYRVSSTDGSVIRTITGPGNGAAGLAWDGTHLWVSYGTNGAHLIYKLDPAAGAVITSIPDPSNGWLGGLTWRDGVLWATQRFPSETVITIDPDDGTVLSTVPAPSGVPRGLVFDDTDLWVASQPANGDFINHVVVPGGTVRWNFEVPEHSSLADRRLRGMAWVNGNLWFLAFRQTTTVLAVHEYEVGNAHASDITIQSVAYDFGDLYTGESAQWSTNVTNVGGADLSISAATFTGTSFTLLAPTTFPVTLPFGGSTAFTIQFAPVAAGVQRDTLRIVSNDPDEATAIIAFRGNGLQEDGNIITVPEELDFGTVWIPNPTLSTSRTLEIHNSGDGELTVTNVQIAVGDYFSVEPEAYPMVVDSHSYFPVRVWFDPQIAGLWDGILTINSDDPNQPLYDVFLSGTAVHAAFEAGDVIWQFWSTTNQWDNSVNAINWINDVNGDDIADVIASCGNGLTYCLNGAASAVGDTFWTYNSNQVQNHTGSVPYEGALRSIPDITGDGIDDVIIGTGGANQSVYALSGETGEELWGFDTDIWNGGGWVNAVEPIADIDGDFIHDVVAATGSGDGTGPRRIIAVSGSDGELIWDAQPRPNSFYSVTVIADVTGDGIPDVVGGSSGVVAGYNGVTGAQLWVRGINGASGTDSPVFELVNMGNANPDVNNSEDVAVASAYDAVFSVDGQTGLINWRHPFASTNVYEVAAGSDITGDGVREVYAGTVSGHVVCIDGALGTEVWDAIADPQSPVNVLSLTNIPDVTGDGIDDLVCGTMGDYVVVLDGWTGEAHFSTTGQGPFAEMDATGVLPDIDNNGSWEVLAGNREGVIQVLCGGTTPPSPMGSISGIIRDASTLLPIANVEVTAEGAAGSAFTSAIGSYALPVPPGTHTIHMLRAGYCELTFEGIVVVENLSTTQNASMDAIESAFSVSSLNVLLVAGSTHTEEFVISNGGFSGCALTYTISDTSDWISCSPSSGEVLPDQDETITVTFDISGLDVGAYQSAIFTEHNDESSPNTITVFLDIVSSADEQATLPTEFKLYPAYPNPFNPSTTIAYDLAADSHVRLQIYNSLGRLVSTLTNHALPRGHYQAVWDGTDDSGIAVGTGLYFVRMQSASYTESRKIVLIK